MKNENYYRKLFKKEHDSLIGKGDNIQNVMTEDCFVRVIKKLTLTDNVKSDSEQLKDKQKLSFEDWLRNLSQEELAWYEGKYVEVFLSL
jgi:hypothetical protein